MKRIIIKISIKVIIKPLVQGSSHNKIYSIKYENKSIKQRLLE